MQEVTIAAAAVTTVRLLKTAATTTTAVFPALPSTTTTTTNRYLLQYLLGKGGFSEVRMMPPSPLPLPSHQTPTLPPLSAGEGGITDRIVVVVIVVVVCVCVWWSYLQF
jgi:hypothetical protein